MDVKFQCLVRAVVLGTSYNFSLICSSSAKPKEDNKDYAKGNPDEEGKSEMTKKGSEPSKAEEPEANKGEEDLVEVEDDDDYLLYLEVILRTVHTAYYELYDQMRDKKKSPSPSTSSSSTSPSVPDLKTVIPYVKVKVFDLKRVFKFFASTASCSRYCRA